MANSQLPRLILRRCFRAVFGKRFLAWHFCHKLLAFQFDDGMVLDCAYGAPIKLKLNTDIGARIFYFGHFEDRELLFFDTLLSTEPAPIILDIGANIGLHSIRWAKGRPGARIFAFEPSSRTASVLRENIRLNGLDRQIEVVEAAVSNQPGQATFFECVDDAYSSLKDTRRKTVEAKREVRVTTVDEFVAARALHSLHLVKIDVEGFETEVIKGAIATLARLKPVLFVEIYGGSDSNRDPEATVTLIQSFGYEAYVLRDGNAVRYSRHDDRFYNYYFTPREPNERFKGLSSKGEVATKL